MRAGRLRHRLRILRPVTSVDPAGGHSSGFELIARRWGSVEGLRGREYFDAGVAHGEVDARVRVRLPCDVRVKDRIEWGKRRFDVQSPPVDVMGRGREAELMVKEYVG